MPATSKKQKRLMDAAAHSPSFAKKVGIPMSVAKDYSESSKGMKFRKGGGDMMKKYAKGGLAMRGEGIAKKGFAKGGQVTASGPDTAGPQGGPIHQPVKKSVQGDTVQVRGVGAARARKATIY